MPWIKELGLWFTSTAYVISNDAPAIVKACAWVAKAALGDRIGICNGTADQVEINAAIVALSAIGGKVQLSEGTFSITAPIVVLPYVSLQGMLLAGYRDTTIRGTTINNVATAGETAIAVNVGGAVSVGAEVKDLSVIGNALSGIGISVENIPWIKISNVRVYGHGGIGIQLSRCWWGGISDSIVQHNGGIGIVLISDSHSWVTRCEIGDNTTRNLYIVDSSEYCLIEDNWFENAALTAVENLRVWNSLWARIIGNVMCAKDTAVTNIYISGDAGEGSKHALVLHNQILDTSRGVYIPNDSGSDAIIAENEFRNIGIAALHIAGDRCQIENNKIGDAVYTVGGATISGERCIFSGNRIYNNTGTALSLGATAIYTVAEGNIIEGGAEHGIFCSANYCTISNNILQGQTNHGINIFRASYCTIANNVTSGNGADGIEIFGDGTNNADFNIVTSNICNGNTNNGIEIIGGTDANSNILKGNNTIGNTGRGVVDAGINTIFDQVMHSIALDLTGGATDIEVFFAKCPCILTGYTIVYSVATGAGAGVNIRVGRYQDGVALDDDYFDVSVSELNKAKGYSKHFVSADLTQTVIATGDTVTVGTAGGKADTGSVILILEIAEMSA